MIYTYRIPRKLKIALAEREMTFSEWCRKNGFNRALAQIVVNSIPFKEFQEGTVSKKIYEALKRDFPEVIKEWEEM